jgi:hypothetical protein
MKLLIATLLISTPLYASNILFSMERSTSLGLDKVEISHTDNKVQIKKTSNWFDRDIDNRLGTFVPQNKKAMTAVIKELEEIQKQLKTAEEKLVSNGSSFNDLNSKKKPHEPFYRLNGFKIQKGSIIYPRLENIAAKINTLQLQLQDGVELEKSRKSYVFYKNGKEISRENFNARFFCETPRFPTRCLAREWGALYLE